MNEDIWKQFKEQYPIVGPIPVINIFLYLSFKKAYLEHEAKDALLTLVRKLESQVCK